MSSALAKEAQNPQVGLLEKGAVRWSLIDGNNDSSTCLKRISWCYSGQGDISLAFSSLSTEWIFNCWEPCDEFDQLQAGMKVCFLEVKSSSDFQCVAGKGSLTAFQVLRFLCDITSPSSALRPLTLWNYLESHRAVRQHQLRTGHQRALPWGCGEGATDDVRADGNVSSVS